MAGGLFALLDDVAMIAKAAASSVDDMASAAAKASAKSAGVIIDDAAVTPQYVTNIPADRELGIIRRIARGSIRNKLFIILPVALILSQFAEWALPILLICGGSFLAFEGAEKVLGWLGLHHAEHLDGDKPSENVEQAENRLVGGAVRTDLILSAEIMLISLAVLNVDSFWLRFGTLVIIAFIMTFLVYGSVSLLVRMDDYGLSLIQSERKWAHPIGNALVKGMPYTLSVIGVIGTFAMLWVGGHLLLVNSDQLGLHLLYGWVHDATHYVHEHMGGFLAWLMETTLSGIAGLLAGLVIVGVIAVLAFGKKLIARK